VHSVSELYCKAEEAYLVTGRRRWRTGRLASSCFSLLLVFCSPDGSVSGFPPSPLFPGFFCSSSCSPSRLPVRSFYPVFFSFSPFCVCFVQGVPASFFVFASPGLPFRFCPLVPPCPCVFVLLCPPFLFSCSFPPCSFSSVRPCSALWFLLLSVFLLLPSGLPSLAFIMHDHERPSRVATCTFALVWGKVGG